MADETPPIENTETAFTDAASAAPPSEPPLEAPSSPPSESPASESPPASPPAVDPVFTSLAERATRIGLDASQYQDVAGLAEGLAAHAAQQQASLQQAQAWIAQQQQQPAEPEPEPEPEEQWDADAHFAQHWDVPAYDEAWSNMIASGAVSKNAAGHYVPSEGHEYLAYSPQLSALNTYAAKQQSATQQFSENPAKWMWSVLQEPLKRMLDERFPQELDGRFQAERESAVIRNFQEKHSGVLYNADGSLKDTGQKFYDAIDALKAAGATDAQGILELAQRMVPLAEQTSVPAATPVPAQPAAAPTPQESFLEQSLQAAAHNPSSGLSGLPQAPGQDTAPLTEDELRQMFIAEAKKLEGAAA